jgi:dihydrodipicolinate synthase/N-acetylneuraminate lyase
LAEVIRIQKLLWEFPPRGAEGSLNKNCKASMKILGLDLGSPRSPFSPVSETENKLLSEALVKLGIKPIAPESKLA